MLKEYFEATFDPQDPLAVWRKKFWDRYAERGWPTSRDEAFQYIPLKDIHIPKPCMPSGTTLPIETPGQLGFVDGFFSAASSRLSPEIVCLPLDQAAHSYGIFLQNRFTRALKEEQDPLALLNGAFQRQGIFLYVPPNVQGHITVVHQFIAQAMATPRILLYLVRGAKLILEQRSHHPHFCNAYLDVVLDAGAHGEVRDLAFASDTGVMFQSIRASLKRDSHLHLSLYSEGTALSRTSLQVQLMEENSQALLQGLSRLSGMRHHHIHAKVEHKAPHTHSRQHFKGVLQGCSRSSFEGKIYVHPIAQKTEAYQLNNYLLLNEGAMAYSKPNLEIFADDVKASHGATLGQLDEEALFYLRSRGMPLVEAQGCLVEGFCRELSGCLP